MCHCFGQRRNTAIKKKQNSPIWDEHLLFEHKDLTEESLGATQVKVDPLFLPLNLRDDYHALASHS